jgi:uncharacterized protein YjeT (DUF2065 family)
MKTALAVLIALFVLEGAILVLWPDKVKSIIGGSREITLRVVGVLELVLVIAILFWVISLR